MNRSRHGRTAIFHARHYRAAINTFRYAERPLDALRRYVTQRGQYPWLPTVRTPVGPVSLLIPHPWDGVTLNEIFFRLDYRTRKLARVVVDIGSNIGISAAWFLSRRPDVVVYCYEPLPRNTDTLRINLAQFPGRWHLETCAVAPTAGRAVFLADPSGRLSGLAEYVQVVGNRTPMEVDCLAAAEVIGSVLAREGDIDLVKIDTEGSEEAILAAIPEDQMCRIGEVIYEGRTGGVHRLRPVT